MTNKPQVTPPTAHWNDTGRYWVLNDGHPIRMNRMTVAMVGMLNEIFAAMPAETLDLLISYAPDREVMASIICEEIVKLQTRRPGPRVDA